MMKNATDKKQLKYDSLGLLDYDIPGKITRFLEVCPKVYCCDFTCPDDVSNTHVKAKGFSKDEQEQLTFSDFQAMLGKADVMRSIKTGRGEIQISGGQVKMTQRDKIKRVGLSRLNRSQVGIGFENSTIASIPFSRTLNKTIYRGRCHVAGDPHLFSLCHGSTLAS